MQRIVREIEEDQRTVSTQVDTSKPIEVIVVGRPDVVKHDLREYSLSRPVWFLPTTADTFKSKFIKAQTEVRDVIIRIPKWQLKREFPTQFAALEELVTKNKGKIIEI